MLSGIPGLRGEHALAVQTMLNNFESLIYCTFPLGFCVASTMRIGQFLGANKAEGAISTSCVAIFTIGIAHSSNVFCCCSGLCDCKLCRHYLHEVPYPSNIHERSAACSGIIRGVGVQRTGAIVSMVCMYIIGGPTGLCLLMLTNLGVSGFWLGLCLGTGLESVVYIVIIKRIDWNEMCRKATKRTEIKFINRPPEQPDIVVKGCLQLRPLRKPRPSTKGDGFELRVLASLPLHGLVYSTDSVVGPGDVGGRFSCEPLVMHDSTPKSTSIIYDHSAVIQANSVSTSRTITWTSSASTPTTNSP
ncbi:Multidrug and toxin extrusion protein [Echinococcus multilocularis]|uniref:Multidrug and toxin extrusion protein n=1 Tax=Echinococcus multilocularis TaxID=6211 RepID=A0A0S4MNG5_ECHMU|nr:Multidrug and toxin extrusion protein [Echinococcus multilocularis]